MQKAVTNDGSRSILDATPTDRSPHSRRSESVYITSDEQRLSARGRINGKAAGMRARTAAPFLDWLAAMVIVRLAEPTDLIAILEFDPFPGERVIEIIERRMLVVDIDDRAEAYAAWQKNGLIGKDYVNKLVVRNSCRRQGLAKRLITSLNTVLCGRVFISAPGKNLAAIQLLESTRWKRAGEIVGLLPFNEAEVFFYKDLWPDPAP